MDSEILAILKSMTTAMQGLQRQCEGLYRLTALQGRMIEILAGEEPSNPEVRELSEQAQKEIAALEELYRRGDPPETPET